MTDGWGQQPQQQWGQQPQYQQGPPQQQWGQQPNAFAGAPGPQQQWGQPQQAQPPSADEFFNNGGGGGAPSFDFSASGVAVLGKILRRKVVAKTQPGSTTQELDRNGNPLWQLNVVLETDLRSWQGIKNPVTTPDGQPVNPAEDQGERQVYLWYTLREAVEKAIALAGEQKLTDGWWLGVKVTGAKPNPKGGNPIKEYVAFYAPTRERLMAVIQGAGGQQPQQGPPPQQQAPQAPPPQQQYAPPPQPQGPPPQQQFAAPGQAPQPGTQYSSEPPF